MLCPVDGGVSAGTHLHTATQKKTRKRFHLLVLSCKNFGGLFYFKHYILDFNRDRICCKAEREVCVPLLLRAVDSWQRAAAI